MTFTPTTLSGTVSAANLNSNFDDSTSALNDLQDGGSGQVVHNVSFEFTSVVDTTKNFYFSLADDMQLLGIGFYTVGGDGALDITWTLAPTVVTAMLNQGTSLTGTLLNVAFAGASPSGADYTSGSPHFLRKGVQYTFSVVSSVSSPALGYVGVALTFKYKPRRR